MVSRFPLGSDTRVIAETLVDRYGNQEFKSNGVLTGPKIRALKYAKVILVKKKGRSNTYIINPEYIRHLSQKEAIARG